MPSDAPPKVAILLCTYHGQRYLAEQLDSFAAQSYKSWEVWASDDCSSDKTQDILQSYQRKWGRDRLSIRCGPAEGFVANFLSLTCQTKIQADYYAYSDQDDVWEVDKLERAINWLKSIPEHIPAMYCSRTRLIDETDHNIGFSPLFTKPPSFPNALMQNIGGGNTMVFNNAACQLLREAGADIDVVTHDWWVYLVVSACGGRVFYDAYPSLRYRQHDDNLVGMNMGWRARLHRIRMLWHGRFRDYNDRNIQALGRLRHKITPENREIFDRFSTLRDRGLFFRLIGMKQCGLYRQTTLGNLGLAVAAIFKKI